MVSRETIQPPDPPGGDPGDMSERISTLISDPLPAEALVENVEGRQVTGPDDGFGKLWRKRYWIRLEGADVSPEELARVWKDRYTEFWPKGSHLYQPPKGLEEGDVAAADLAMIAGTRVGTGIIVKEVNDTSFTFATLEGHTLAGTITFSGRVEDGVTVAHVEVLMRAGDPIYEIGMPLGGHHHENNFWKASLVALAKYYGVDAEPHMIQECLDPKRQWQNTGNIVNNAFLHTAAYLLTRPIRSIAGRIRSRGTST
jgi:hypothetical protein